MAQQGEGRVRIEEGRPGKARKARARRGDMRPSMTRDKRWEEWAGKVKAWQGKEKRGLAR